MMKKIFVLLLCLMICLCGAVHAEEAPERTVAPYEYALGAEPAYYENLIFNADVVISGENAQIIFSNCEFNGDIILTSEEGTRVLLLGCEVKGTCIMDNAVNAGMDYNNPKFLTDAPITAVCENGMGSVVAIGDFEFTFNGETCSMAVADLFSDANAPEAGLVAYEGQEAVYCIAAQLYENGEKTMVVINENEVAE